MTRLLAKNITTSIAGRRIAKNAICFDTVDSTNDIAWDAATQSQSDGLVITAEQQRAGRGRIGKQWISPVGAGLLVSVILRDEELTLASETLTIAAGLAVAEGIDEVLNLSCRLKWPNDVLIAGAKVAGVLIESRKINGDRYYVIGMGINVSASPELGDVCYQATNLAEQFRRRVDRAEVLRAVLRHLDSWVANISAGKVDRLGELWRQRCDMINQRISVRCAGSLHTGRVVDISALDGLILQLDRGLTLHLPAETSTIIDAKTHS